MSQKTELQRHLWIKIKLMCYIISIQEEKKGVTEH